MKKKWFLLIAVVVSVGIGGKMYMDEQRLNKEMLAVVQSDEAKQVFERGLKNLDPNALTPEGVIKSYEVDYDSIKHNPMGGINISLIINKKEELKAQFNIDKRDNILVGDGINLSKELTIKIDGVDNG